MGVFYGISGGWLRLCTSSRAKEASDLPDMEPIDKLAILLVFLSYSMFNGTYTLLHRMRGHLAPRGYPMLAMVIKDKKSKDR
jgi:hypothetical protein